MNDWLQVQQLLAKVMASFLGDVLPSLGRDSWWTNHVLQQLTTQQLRIVESLPVGQLRSLDFAALLRVTKRNWSEIAYTRKMPREGRFYLEELEGARNRFAHAPVDGLPLNERLRDVDTAYRLMKILGADSPTLWATKQILDGMAEESEEKNGSPPPPAGEENCGGEAKPQDPVRSVTTAIDAGWLLGGRDDGAQLHEILRDNAFVGIDFGTSTSVVSVVTVSDAGRLEARALRIEQPDDLGGTNSHHLVNTVLAWSNQKLLFGAGAYKLRQRLFEGKNVFSSFKMRLGISMGPIYPATELRRDECTTPVETAQDAAYRFFSLLRPAVDLALLNGSLPKNIRLAVTVPASFEANQRRDLIHALAAFGLDSTTICMIDEPNAAFLSYLHSSSNAEAPDALFQRLLSRPANVLVYDFGAGTCDISILEVGIDGRKIRSRNRAISRFTALGGDDLDRAIAKHVLLPQLVDSAPRFEPTEREIEERLIPWLQPTAERLKINAFKWAADKGFKTLDDLKECDQVFEENPVQSFRFQGRDLGIRVPTLKAADLYQCLSPFFGLYDPEESRMHVFAPVADAMQKTGLSDSELDAVLFIGGSADNPIAQQSVMRLLPPTVTAIVPGDLRSHVSLGAALHSFAYHGLAQDLVTPITSEPIMIVTRGGGLELVVPAGSVVPTPKAYETDLSVNRAGQQVVELPICVTNETKLLGLLRLESPDASGFRSGTNIKVTATLNHEKLLNIVASAAGLAVEANLLNPLSNSELSVDAGKMLEAKQRFNQEVLDYRGRPTAACVLALANSAMKAKEYMLAADMYIQAERLEAGSDHATSICIALERGGKRDQSREWARKAYDRNPCATTAYNMAVFSEGEDKLQYLKTAVSKDDPPPFALLALGKMLRGNSQQSGTTLVERCVNILERKLSESTITASECWTLIDAAKLLRKDGVVERSRARLEQLTDTGSVYDEDNLAAGRSDITMGMQAS